MQKNNFLSEIRSFAAFELKVKQAVEGFITGIHRSPYRGFSVEFAEHKLYNSGESVRHMDWKLYSRTDRLYTKTYDEETNLRACILVDVSPSMYYPETGARKIDFAAFAAGCLSTILQKQRDAIGLYTFSDTTVYAGRIKSTGGHLATVLGELASLTQREPGTHKTDTAAVLNEIAETIRQRSLIVIFSDMFDNVNAKEKMFNALRHLKHKKHEVILFHVFDKKTEQMFDFDEQAYELTDTETGEKLVVKPNEIRQSYREMTEAYFDELKIKCGQSKIDFHSVDLETDFKQLMISFLIKRGSMR